MPLTVLKVRYESTLYGYSSLVSAARDIARREGFRGFFAGYGATAVRDAPYAGLYVLVYEQSKKRLGRLFAGGGGGNPGDNNRGGGGEKMALSRAASINFASGVLSGVVCSVISNPFDAVKTRIQLQPGQYRNMVHAARRMVREEGFRSLMDGLTLRMSRKALSSALAWTVYEELIRRAEITWSARTHKSL
jgi:solute carrier family 25 protein 38